MDSRNSFIYLSNDDQAGLNFLYATRNITPGLLETKVDCNASYGTGMTSLDSSESEYPYHTPDWAQAPSNANWTLMEVKDGVELATLSLAKKPCTTFGRTDDCDVTLLHGSISRLHARIAFDSTGAPWLKDLESTHGVTVNKKRLPPSSVSRRESNSTMAGARGVRIFPGDILQFGASTRIYCVQGPPEYERNRTMNMSKDAKLTVQETVSLKEPSSKNGNDCTALGDETLREDVIPPTHRKQWEQLVALSYKLENLERESSRINAKSNVQELTDGQERQLEKNQEKIDQVKASTDAMELELKKVIFGSSHGQASGMHRTHENHEEDEDVVDRTRDFHNDGVSDEPEQATTEEAMSSAWVALCKEYQSVAAKVTSLSRAATTLQNKLTDASNEERAGVKPR
jgi:pSer/pThr/pTyr-binding forkhead associated (FHA) protein